MDTAADLPRLYELHTYDTVDDILGATVHLAESGAEEGSLLWAHAQRAGRGRLGGTWHSPPGALHCGLVLRPDVPLNTALELLLVAQVALGSAIAELVSPMTELRYRWPNDILLSRAKAAGLNVAAGPLYDGVPEWLVLIANVNVTQRPAALGFAAASLRTEGDCDADAQALLGAFARQFLSWINRWAESGLEPIRRLWLQRPDGIGEACRLATAAGLVEATLLDLGPQGEAVLRLADGSARAVALEEYFEFTNPPPHLAT